MPSLTREEATAQEDMVGQVTGQSIFFPNSKQEHMMACVFVGLFLPCRVVREMLKIGRKSCKFVLWSLVNRYAYMHQYKQPLTVAVIKKYGH